mmetsp:Transcript_17186/g.48781  ORF Transcript_17186/g.48781 Transcript_17186/m.48781 type:complete len:617 (+) Transcript_17186:383-2233(+)
MAAGCFSSCGHGAVPAKIISEMSANDVWPPPSASITALASVLADCNDDDSKETAFLMLHGLMMDGQHHGNLADYRECLVQQHPAVLDSALVYVERMNSKDDNGLHALGFLMTAFDTDPPAAMPTSVWLGLFRGAVRIATHVDSALREFMHSNVVAIMKLVASNTEYVLAEAGDRDELYRGGCISVVSRLAGHISMGPSDEENVAFCARHVPTIVGEDTDLGPHSDRAKIAVRDGLPVALCQLTLACIRHHISQQQVDTFIAFAISILRALVSYGDRVSSWRGTFRPNSVTRSILQHDSVKTMRAAEGHLSRKKGQKQQLTVPKELLDLFAEIESAANERADAQLAAELAEFDINEGNKETPSSSKSSKKSKAKKRSKAADKNLPSVGHADKVQDGHDSLPRPASPSPQRPPLGACPPSSVSSNEPSVPPMDRSTVPQQQQGSSDDAGPFMRVGRKRRGKAAQTDQVASPLQDQWSFPGPASAPSRPSSSSSFRHHEPPVPLTPPLQPPTAPPVRHAPAAVGASSASSHAQPPAGPSAAATAATAAAAASIGGVIETKEVKCCVCLLNEPNVILLPCRHKVVCGECFDKWMAPMPREDRICPEHTCRQPYSEATRIL